MEIKQQININASADKVWGILSNDFANVTKWATRMINSERSSDLGPIGGRSVNTVEYGEATETLYRFDEEQRDLAYHVRGDNLPPMISDVTTGWRVDQVSETESAVTTTFGAAVSPEMEEMISGRLLQGLIPLLEELKYYAENDQPHPRKVTQITSQ